MVVDLATVSALIVTEEAHHVAKAEEVKAIDAVARVEVSPTLGDLTEATENLPAETPETTPAETPETTPAETPATAGDKMIPAIAGGNSRSNFRT